MSTEITPNTEVASRAYHLWEQAGRPHGRDLEFWIKAETDTRAAAGGHSTHPTAAPATHSLRASLPIRSNEKAKGQPPFRPGRPAEKAPRGIGSRVR